MEKRSLHGQRKLRALSMIVSGEATCKDKRVCGVTWVRSSGGFGCTLEAKKMSSSDWELR